MRNKGKCKAISRFRIIVLYHKLHIFKPKYHVYLLRSVLWFKYRYTETISKLSMHHISEAILEIKDFKKFLGIKVGIKITH